MERHKRDKKHRKKPPRVPIKTYKWEDIRRARLKGGYPWTYLYKEPFKEYIDSKLFKMDGSPKSKSSSSLQKSTDGVVIKEVTNGVDEHLTIPEPSSYIVITEVPSDSENHSKSAIGGSVIIEDVEEPETLNLESAESSDNISQYLDKEEPIPEPTPVTPKTSATEEATTSQNGRQERAKSEEPKRKRKLSIDSSYSRKSLSKLAIIKKLKEAKDKIKVPKLTLPKSLKASSSPNNENKKKEEKPKDTQYIQPSKSNENPVYIHIPLKPPEGQTDEFSYLEFGDKKPEEKKPEEDKSEETIPEERKIQQKPSNELSQIKIEVEPPDSAPDSSNDHGYQRRDSEHPDDIVAIEVLKTEDIDFLHASRCGLNELCVIQPENAPHSSDIMIYLPPPDEPESTLERKPSKKKAPSRQGSKKIRAKSAEPEKRSATPVRAKSAEPERKRKLSLESSYSSFSLSKQGILRRLKNAKEKLKFPTLSLSRSDSKKGQAKKAKEPETILQEIKKETPKSESTSAGPKYIHIPLKPPAGQTDEFSYLEFEEKEEKKDDKPAEIQASEPEQQSSVESPPTAQNEGVQFIFLTPPSDDEILDKPDIPETPSSDTTDFFRINELKEIAQDAAEKVSPESRRKKLDTVTEEEKPKAEESESSKKAAAAETKQVEKMVVDEEDGLKLTESAMAKQEQNIKSKEIVELTQEAKSSLKTDGSPVLKKKVSFKRRSRDDSKDGVYEDIQAPADEKAKQQKQDTTEEPKSKLVTGNSQSMSVDEEKSYLDEKKIIKTTSLEEDYNRWSKLSDHEYEPVNPPPDNTIIGSKHTSPLPAAQASAPTSHGPTVHVIDTDHGTTQQKTISLASSTTSLERRMLGAETEPTPEEPFTVQDMQTDIENQFFSKTPKERPKQTTTVHTSVVSTSKPQTQRPKTEGPGKFQQAIRTQAGKFKTKLHGIKKPNIKLPPKPNFDKLKFEKPKINLPKMPDTAKITLPTFSLPRKNPLKRSLKQRHLSTESNAGGSKTNYFDFRTYPRLFKKKHKDDFDSSFSSKSEREAPEFATVPRTKRSQPDDRWGGRDTIRIPLHAEDSIENNEREDSVERRMAAHMRYDQDIDIDDAYEKENQEIHTASPFSHGYNSRWNHGSFHPQPNLEFREETRNNQVTDLDSPGDAPAPHESFDTNTSKDIHSSESSLGIHRRGVLEEIDSDEFFLRQKGISQDNIEVGMYLSSEIREAFKSPTNALADLQREPRDFSYELRTSNQSLPETPTKRKVIKKPKRKKTPHVSQEQISFDQDSELEAADAPPSRPKRRSKRSKKGKEPESVIPYQETIAVDAPDENETLKHLEAELEEYKAQYENEQMQGKEQPEIQVTDPYTDDFKYEEKYESDDEVFRDEEPAPAAPPRKNRSLKSLNFSEHDSILGDFNDKEPLSQEFEVYKTEHEYIIPTPEIPPTKPPRTLSRSSSKSRDHEEVEETPIRPTRTRSRSRTRTGIEEPCVEETCVQDFRDSMGYAVIDKNTRREPPLPPPRTPPRRKRDLKSVQSSISEQRFFTVPRPLSSEPPMRPLRNYSTLGPSRPPRRRPTINMTDEEKENIDITQYIEIDDEPNPDLISGEVIQKMRDRPLPAPPRPPRNKAKTLQDITTQENIFNASQENIESELQDFEKEDLEETKTALEELEESTKENQPAEEAEVSTQTEPLPDDFVCDELVQEPHDKTITPRRPQSTEPDTITVERRLITPTHYTYDEETITHGSLVIEPLNGAKILPDSEITQRERSIPITKDYEDETSEIPEEFTKLRDPTPTLPRTTTPQPQVIERIIERPVMVQPDSGTEVEVLKAQKLQVGDLDVDRLSVNELMASKIIVSEIDSGNIQTHEISSKSGALKVGEIELPPSLVQQLFERLQSVAQEQQSSGHQAAPETSAKSDESEDPGQKKNSV